MSAFNNISDLTQISKYLVVYEINFCEMPVIKLKQRLSSVVFEMTFISKTDLSRNMRAPHLSLACEKSFPVSFLNYGLEVDTVLYSIAYFQPWLYLEVSCLSLP